MAITREQVLHVAKLAHLELTEEEVERFREQLYAILDAVVEGLRARPRGRAADVASARARERLARRRAGAVAAARGRVFANAPERDGDFFRVPPTGEVREP